MSNHAFIETIESLFRDGYISTLSNKEDVVKTGKEYKEHLNIRKDHPCLHLHTHRKKEFLLPSFNCNTNGLEVMADAILFYQREEGVFVFIVEMKATKDDQQLAHAEDQANATELLAKYICDTAIRIRRLKDILESPKIFYRKWIVSHMPTTQSYHHKIMPREHEYINIRSVVDLDSRSIPH